MYDIIIIGAGPSGLTSAIYALRANKKVLVLESNCYGGQIVNASLIENYPGIKNIDGYSFASSLYEQASSLGMEYKLEKVIKVESGKVYTTDNEYTTKSIIIATGCKNKKLGIEDKFLGKGVSYCATCDGNFYRGKDVAVVGGGNTALEDALYLSKIVNNVYLIHRRDSFRGEEKYVSELKKCDNVHFIMNATIDSLNGNDVLESITVSSNEIKVSGLFIAIGQIPNTEVFNNLDLDEFGYIKSDDCKTNIKGIYAAGDVRKKDLRQLTTAVGDGAIASYLAINEME